MKDWFKFLLEVNPKGLTPSEANDILIEFYASFQDFGWSPDQKKQIDIVIYELDQIADKLIPEDD